MHFYCDNSSTNTNDNNTNSNTDTSIINNKDEILQAPPSPPPSSSSSSSIASPAALSNKMNDLLTTTSTASSINSNENTATVRSHLTSNPETWTAEQVKSWLNWCASEYALMDIPFEKFVMNGKALCMLNEDMFKKRVPNSGDILYQALQNLIPRANSTNYQLEGYTNGNNNSKALASSLYYSHHQQQDPANMLDTATNNVNSKNLFTGYKTTTEIAAQFNNSDNEDEDNSGYNKNKLIIDENSNNSENSYKLQQQQQQQQQQQKQQQHTNKRKSTPTASSSSSSTSTVNANSRKRTANSRLENLIGNLKSRKLNTNTTAGSGNDDNGGNDYSAGFSQPLSPSASSTTSSISRSSLSPSPPHTDKNAPANQHLYHHSMKKPTLILPSTVPTNHHDLMNLLQQAVVANAKHYAMTNNGNDNGSAADSANCTASSPSSTRCDQDCTPVSSCASDNGHPASPQNVFNEYASMLQVTTKPAKATKAAKQQANKQQASEKVKLNAEDPTRQIKFYDDYIDFRGDILRRPPNAKNCRILWEYLYLLLQDKTYNAIIRWEDSVQMVFRIVQAEKLAALWGLQKNRLGMTYEKLSRGMRYYYPNNIIAREPGRRLLYRFMRHPDDIKKSVKKNGTYMLKRAKLELKNAKLNGSSDSNANKSVSPKALDEEDIDCGGDEIIDDELGTNVNDVDDEADLMGKNQTNDDGNNNNDDSGLDETSTISPVPEKKQKLNHINHSDKNQNKYKIVKNSNQQQQQITTTVNNSQLPNNFYPNLYPFITAQMAAVMQKQQPQQQQQQQATNFFPRASNNEEVLAAQFLMQLRNQNEAGQLNLQQIFSQNDVFTHNNRNQQAKLPVKFSKKQQQNDVDDEPLTESKLPHRSNTAKSQHELPLNLSVNSKKRKLTTTVKRTSDDENQENDTKKDIKITVEEKSLIE